MTKMIKIMFTQRCFSFRPAIYKTGNVYPEMFDRKQITKKISFCLMAVLKHFFDERREIGDEWKPPKAPDPEGELRCTSLSSNLHEVSFEFKVSGFGFTFSELACLPVQSGGQDRVWVSRTTFRFAKMFLHSCNSCKFVDR